MASSTLAYEKLVAKIADVWNLDTENIARATTLNIQPLEQKLSESEMTLPCALVVFWEDKEMDLGANNSVYATRCSAIYITSRTGDSFDALETACEDLKDALYPYYESYTTGAVQVKTSPIKNADINSFNKLCLERSNGLIGGEVMFHAIYGGIPS